MPHKHQKRKVKEHPKQAKCKKRMGYLKKTQATRNTKLKKK